MADLIISSLRGGMNDSDPPIALEPDQVVLAKNVEFTVSTCGERRRGSEAVDLSGSNVAAKASVTFLHRHLPSVDEADAELFAFGYTSAVSYAFDRKDTSWHAVSFVDNPLLTDGGQYNFQAVTVHGKSFIVYKSGVDRLHVWDGTTFRRAGLKAVATAPTAVETGSAGTFAGNRYYRTREIVKSGSTILRRSEPGPNSALFVPSGTKTGATVTKPADMGENATHWELEGALAAAPDDFYLIATTVVGTATATDTTSPSYDAAGFDISEESGAYTVPHSPEFVVVDEDRLVLGGALSNDALSSRVAWTSVYNDPGVGNDERIPIATVQFYDLDTYEGGRLTGITPSINGALWVFKRNHIYKLVRTNNVDKAYNRLTITKKRGALKGSIVEGVDQGGRACLYFLDPHVGPCRIGVGGLQQCGADILTTWKRVNTDATVVCRSYFDADNRQVHWFVAFDGSDTPTYRLVLQCNQTRDTDEGVRRGFSVWDGESAKALCVCLFAENIDEGTDRSTVLKPLIGTANSGRIWQLNTDAIDDNGTDYTATITTKPYTPANIMHQFKVMAGALLAKASQGISVVVTAVKDFGITTKAVNPVDLSPVASEDHVIRPMNGLTLGALSVVQFTIEDPATPTGRWELHQLATKETSGQSAQ